MIASTAIGAGANLLGGGLDQFLFDPKKKKGEQDVQGKAGAASVASINDALAALAGETALGQERLLDGFDNKGLTNLASQRFTQSSNALRSSLGGAGLGRSGVADAAISGAFGQAITGLATEESNQQLARTQGANQMGLQSVLAALAASQNPAFGAAAFDPAQPKNSGAK